MILQMFSLSTAKVVNGLGLYTGIIYFTLHFGEPKNTDSCLIIQCSDLAAVLLWDVSQLEANAVQDSSLVREIIQINGY